MLMLRFTLLVLGLTYLVTQSSIFALVRIWVTRKSTLLGTLLYCPACAGFWIGLGVGLAGGYPLPSLFGALDAAVVACGLMATWAYAFVRTTSWELEQHAEKEEQENG